MISREWLDDMKEYLRTEEGVDVADFGYVGTKGNEVAVAASGDVYVFDVDFIQEEATLICEYPLSMIIEEEGI